MEIKDLEIGDEVQIVRGVQRVRDEDDEKWVYEPCFEKGEVIDVYEKGSEARVDFKNGTCTVINANTEWYKVPSNTKIATHSEVKRPHHYMFEDGTEAIKIINMLVKRYKQSTVAAQIYNAIKYIIRAPFKNGVKDLKKAKESINFAIKFWDNKEMEYKE
ncbi:DUF3310 domain-containing protein [Staphylococcus pseudintermedius]|nr:hypothetical protein [Staphylococcus pseudintermedius]EGQ3997216.1 DUF3310 domain-containing protein [Staphylococcus pseudintermedius]EIK0270542.1 DUF3310 domain-containing protein [Staphylococcus pseudintermedius]EJP6625632.1 DUF3310 domain-containing protein [Staphylococcus pseudintermedius]ELH8542738.1 DUF3310 domain-containing protein [Staphylococcus pseudintermedius]